jgi:hypothetical protein
MRFKLARNRTIASTCGLAIEFKKDEYHFVPPAMYNEVIAAGGVAEDEGFDHESLKPTNTPEVASAREAVLFAAFESIAKRNHRNEFTAGGMPHLSVLAKAKGVDWEVTNKERDAAWVKFLAKVDD